MEKPLVKRIKDKQGFFFKDVFTFPVLVCLTSSPRKRLKLYFAVQMEEYATIALLTKQTLIGCYLHIP